MKQNNILFLQFDLVIDTNRNNLKEVIDIIVSEYRKWIEK